MTGTIGDATITKSSLWVRDIAHQWLGNGEYIAKVKLEGFLVAKDSMFREGGWLMFDLTDDKLEGGFSSSGIKAGDPERMFIAVAYITLYPKSPNSTGNCM